MPGDHPSAVRLANQGKWSQLYSAEHELYSNIFSRGIFNAEEHGWGRLWNVQGCTGRSQALNNTNRAQDAWEGWGWEWGWGIWCVSCLFKWGWPLTYGLYSWKLSWSWVRTPAVACCVWEHPDSWKDGLGTKVADQSSRSISRRCWRCHSSAIAIFLSPAWVHCPNFIYSGVPFMWKMSNILRPC